MIFRINFKEVSEMRNKLFALLAFAALFMNIGGALSAQTKTVKQSNQLAALLPNSDGVIVLDTQKLLTEAAPQLFASKPDWVNRLNAGIDDVRDKTGLDARQFEQVVIGVTAKQISAKEVNLEPVFLTRGKFNANALIAIAKLAVKGKYREEKSGSRTIYIFQGVNMADSNKPAASKDSWLEKAMGRMLNGLSKELAVTSLDDNTLAFGSIARVRETIEGKSRISGETLDLANRKSNAVMSFGAKLPNGLSGFMELDNDELGKTLDSIRQVSGAMEVADGSPIVSLTAKTLKAEQAQNLLDTLVGLQMFGKVLLGSNKSADKQVYARMIENAKITRNLSEVNFDLQVPSTDISILLAGIK